MLTGSEVPHRGRLWAAACDYAGLTANPSRIGTWLGAIRAVV